MKHILSHILPSLLLLSPAMMSGATITETLAEIERNNLSLRAAAAENEAAELEMRSDNTLPATSVEYSPFFRSGIDGVASSELVVSQEFDFPTLYASRSRQASLEREALDSKSAVERRDMLLQAREALLKLVLLNRERDILDRRFSDSSMLLEAYKRSLELGKATLLEVNRVKLEHEDMKREILQNDADRAALTATLRRLNADRPLDLTDLDYDIPAEDLMILPGVEAILQADPAVLAAEADVKAARQGVSVARSGWLPSITLGYRRNTEEKESANGFLAGISLQLFGTPAKTRAAKARLNAGMLRLEAARAEAESSIAESIAALQIQTATLATYDLTLMEETLTLYRKSLDAGQISLTTYYTETTLLYDRMLTRVRLEDTIRQTLSRLTANLL